MLEVRDEEKRGARFVYQISLRINSERDADNFDHSNQSIRILRITRYATI